MKKYTAGDYYNAVDAFAPFSLAESWDNVGLLIGSPETPVQGALIALDATIPVLEEAGKMGARLVITHHPIIFSGIKSIPAHSPVYRAIKDGTPVLCAHTNLDIATGGVNDQLARRLGLDAAEILETTKATPYRKVIVYAPHERAEAVYEAMTNAGAGSQGAYAGAAFFSGGEGRFLPLAGANPAIGGVGRLEKVPETRIEMLVSPGDLEAVIGAMRAAHPYEEPAFDILETHFDRQRQGFGRVGNLKEPLSPEKFAAHVRERLGLRGVKCVLGREEISRVAACGGAGAHLLEQAKKMGAQALVSGDAKHSQFLQAQELGITLIDAGHYSTEAVVLQTLLEQLTAALPGAEIALAKSCADPGIIA